MLDDVNGARSSAEVADQTHETAEPPELAVSTAPPNRIARPAHPDAPPVIVVDRTTRVVWWLAAHAPLVTAVLAGAVALIGFRGGDYPAQDYRAFMFGAHGFLIWDVNWYGGHAALGYSVLFPAVGWLLGTVPATALACVLSTALFGRVVGRANNWPAVVSRVWFAVFVVGDLIVGRAPFACGLTAALAAILAVRAERPIMATLAAVVASLFSPLVAAFVLLIALAWAATIGWRRTLPFAGAGVGLLVTLVAGDGGVFPFPWTAFAGQAVLVIVGLVVAPFYERALRRMLWLYGLSCVVLFLVPNPVGGNIARLAGIAIGPVAALVLLRAGRRIALLVVALPLLILQLLPIIAAVSSAANDPSTNKRYYQGVLRYLVANQQPLSRVEVPFTKDHWEATYIAEKVPLARGWDRQVDLSHNNVLYASLSVSDYRAWLDENAVRFIALPTAALDKGGVPEKELLKHPPSWLHTVYTDDHWRVWEISGAIPLATGAATMTALTPGSFTLHAATAGATFVRLRWSPYWHVSTANACVAQARGGWTTVLGFVAGDVKVTERALLSETTCTSAQLATAGVEPVDADAPK